MTNSYSSVIKEDIHPKLLHLKNPPSKDSIVTHERTGFSLRRQARAFLDQQFRTNENAHKIFTPAILETPGKWFQYL
jgi:hypothetical protein